VITRTTKFEFLRRRTAQLFLAAAIGSLALAANTCAQFGFPPPQHPANPKAIAPIDLTGYWVAVVTEDWRFRMLTPPKGDYGGVPLNSEGKRVADSWDPARDEASGNSCKSYGAAAIMRVPTRLHVSWENDTTLRVDTDAGTQTRLLHFGGTPPAGTAQWQGYSAASWEGLPEAGMFRIPTTMRGIGEGPAREGYLKVITTHLRAGYLRKNGAPYSENAILEEYFDSFKEPNGDAWLVVTAIVTDPQYLYEPFIVSSHFKKQADASGWNPTPCEAK